MTAQQPEALRLAADLEEGNFLLSQERNATAHTLRKLHAQVQELETELDSERRHSGASNAAAVRTLAAMGYSWHGGEQWEARQEQKAAVVATVTRDYDEGLITSFAWNKLSTPQLGEVGEHKLYLHPVARSGQLHARVQELEAQLVQPSREQINRWLEVHKLMTIDPDVWKAAQQERKPLTDGDIVAAQEKLIAAKDELYRSRIGQQCSRCSAGKYRADGNGYHDFHRCDNCRHVPMWNPDGTEFAPPKPNQQERWLCLLCKSSRPGHHGFLDDGTTPCPNKGKT